MTPAKLGWLYSNLITTEGEGNYTPRWLQALQFRSSVLCLSKVWAHLPKMEGSWQINLDWNEVFVLILSSNHVIRHARIFSSSIVPFHKAVWAVGAHTPSLFPLFLLSANFSCIVSFASYQFNSFMLPPYINSPVPLMILNPSGIWAPLLLHACLYKPMHAASHLSPRF
jgi:hypothetical protein